MDRFAALNQTDVVRTSFTTNLLMFTRLLLSIRTVSLSDNVGIYCLLVCMQNCRCWLDPRIIIHDNLETEWYNFGISLLGFACMKDLFTSWPWSITRCKSGKCYLLVPPDSLGSRWSSPTPAWGGRCWRCLRGPAAPVDIERWCCVTFHKSNCFTPSICHMLCWYYWWCSSVMHTM